MEEVKVRCRKKSMSYLSKSSGFLLTVLRDENSNGDCLQEVGWVKEEWQNSKHREGAQRH
jgi:hypothetical protein